MSRRDVPMTRRDAPAEPEYRPAPRRRRKRLTRILVIVAVVFVALWCGYWYATNRMVTSAIAHVATSFASKGQALACTDDAIGGFPLSLNLDCNGPSYADGTAAVSATLGRLSASAPLYWPGSVSTALAGPLIVKAPHLGLVFDASWSSGVADAAAGLGGLSSAGASFEDLAINNAKATKALPIVSFSAAHASAEAAPASGGAYRLTVEGDGIVVKPVGAAGLPPFEAVIDVKALGFGSSLGSDPQGKLRAWLANGGQLQVDRIMIAVGASSATLSGTLAISADGLLSGDLNLRLIGLDSLDDAVAGLKRKTRKQVTQIGAAIAAFTKPADDDPNARDAPVVIRNGAVSVGIIPVGDIPPLKL